MSIPVRINTQATVRHRAGNLAGTGTVSGILLADFVAAGLTLRDPTTNPSGLAVTMGEVGVTGYYDFFVTPNLVGFWELEITDPASPPAPAATAEATNSYWVNASAAAAIAGIAARDLTTRARVRDRLHMIDVNETEFDDLIDELITEASNWIQDDFDRCIPEDAYVEYLDGTDAPDLWLREGPLVSVSSVEEIEYVDDGAGGLQENRTTLPAFHYAQENTITEKSLLRGVLRRVDGGVWHRANPRRWRVVYVAGQDPLPDGIVHLATTWVVHEFVNRESRWNASKVLEDGQLNLLTPGQLEREKGNMLSPYRDLAGEW